MAEQLGFDGMPRRLYPCTPSRLRAWLDCPRRYRMTYLDRPAPAKGPPWAHNSFGASIHNALAGWWKLPRGHRTVPAAGGLLNRGWISEGFADDAQSELHRRRARVMVETYVATLDPDAEPVGVERTVAMKTDLVAISGRVDRLDDRVPEAGSGRKLVVVDYKTGRHPLTSDDVRASMTLALYALAAGRMFRRPCTTVELHHLPTGQVHGWEHTAGSLDRQLRRAEEIAAECAEADDRFGAGQEAGRGDAVFPPRPGAWCGWCDYRAHCPEGRQAVPARRPWDGLTAADPAGDA